MLDCLVHSSVLMSLLSVMVAISEHARLKPKHYPERDMCVSFAKDYLFFDAVQYIHQVCTVCLSVSTIHNHAHEIAYAMYMYLIIVC